MRIRNGIAALFTLLGATLILGAVLSSWIAADISDDTGFRANILASAQDPVVVAAATDQMTAELTTSLLADLAATPLATGPDGSTPTAPTPEQLGVAEAAQRAATSSEFAEQWVVGWSAGRPLWFVPSNTSWYQTTQSTTQTTTITINTEPAAAVARDQIAAAGWPSFAGADLDTTGLVITVEPEPLAGLSQLPDARTALLGGGVALLTVAYLLSTRRKRLTLLLGAELVAGAVALWLLTLLMKQQVTRAGVTDLDSALSAAAFAPFSHALQVSSWITGGLGLFLILVALTALSFRTDEERHVRSRGRHGERQAEVR